MISNKLKLLFFISIPVFIMHGLEEYITGFYNTDSFSQFAFHYAQQMTVFQGTFLTFQIMWWLLLLVIGFALVQKRWQIYLMSIIGLIFIFELHHIVKALFILGYYPGLLSGLAFPILGFFYWKELMRNWRKQ